MDIYVYGESRVEARKGRDEERREERGERREDTDVDRYPRTYIPM
jgi:hypothetical protein